MKFVTEMFVGFCLLVIAGLDSFSWCISSNHHQRLADASSVEPVVSAVNGHKIGSTSNVNPATVLYVFNQNNTRTDFIVGVSSAKVVTSTIVIALQANSKTVDENVDCGDTSTLVSLSQWIQPISVNASSSPVSASRFLRYEDLLDATAVIREERLYKLCTTDGLDLGVEVYTMPPITTSLDLTSVLLPGFTESLPSSSASEVTLQNVGPWSGGLGFSLVNFRTSTVISTGGTTHFAPFWDTLQNSNISTRIFYPVSGTTLGSCAPVPENVLLGISLSASGVSAAMYQADWEYVLENGRYKTHPLEELTVPLCFMGSTVLVQKGRNTAAAGIPITYNWGVGNWLINGSSSESTVVPVDAASSFNVTLNISIRGEQGVSAFSSAEFPSIADNNIKIAADGRPDSLSEAASPSAALESHADGKKMRTIDWTAADGRDQRWGRSDLKMGYRVQLRPTRGADAVFGVALAMPGTISILYNLGITFKALEFQNIDGLDRTGSKQSLTLIYPYSGSSAWAVQRGSSIAATNSSVELYMSVPGSHCSEPLLSPIENHVAVLLSTSTSLQLPSSWRSTLSMTFAHNTLDICMRPMASSSGSPPQVSTVVSNFVLRLLRLHAVNRSDAVSVMAPIPLFRGEIVSVDISTDPRTITLEVGVLTSTGDCLAVASLDPTSNSVTIYTTTIPRTAQGKFCFRPSGQSGSIGYSMDSFATYELAALSGLAGAQAGVFIFSPEQALSRTIRLILSDLTFSLSSSNIASEVEFFLCSNNTSSSAVTASRMESDRPENIFLTVAAGTTGIYDLCWRHQNSSASAEAYLAPIHISPRPISKSFFAFAELPHQLTSTIQFTGNLSMIVSTAPSHPKVGISTVLRGVGRGPCSSEVQQLSSQRVALSRSSSSDLQTNLPSNLLEGVYYICGAVVPFDAAADTFLEHFAELGVVAYVSVELNSRRTLTPSATFASPVRLTQGTLSIRITPQLSSPVNATGAIMEFFATSKRNCSVDPALLNKVNILGGYPLYNLTNSLLHINTTLFGTGGTALTLCARLSSTSLLVVDTKVRVEPVTVTTTGGKKVTLLEDATSVTGINSTTPALISFSEVKRSYSVGGTGFLSPNSWTVRMFESETVCTDIPTVAVSLAPTSATSATFSFSGIKYGTMKTLCLSYVYEGSTVMLRTNAILHILPIVAIERKRADNTMQAGMIGLSHFTHTHTLVMESTIITGAKYTMFIAPTSDCDSVSYQLPMSLTGSGATVVSINGSMLGVGGHIVCAQATIDTGITVYSNLGITLTIAKVKLASTELLSGAVIASTVNVAPDLRITGSYLSALRLYVSATDSIDCSGTLSGTTIFGNSRALSLASGCGNSVASVSLPAASTGTVSSSPMIICIAMSAASDDEPSISSLVAFDSGLKLAVTQPTALVLLVQPSALTTSDGGLLIQPVLAMRDASSTATLGSIPSGTVIRAEWFIVYPFDMVSLREVYEITTVGGESQIDFTTSPVFLKNGKFSFQYVLRFTATTTSFAVSSVLSQEVSFGACPSKSEWARPFSDQCETCPENALCDGTTNLRVSGSFWRASNVSKTFYSCGEPYSADTCLANTSTGTCENGHHGPRCSVCEENFAKSSNYCVECLNDARDAFLVALVFLVVIIIVFVLVLSTLQCKKSDQFPIYFKLFINHLTVSSTIGEFSNLPTAVIQLFRVQRQVSRPSPTFAAFDCSTGFDWYDKFIFVTTAPLALGLVLAVFLALQSKRVVQQKVIAARKSVTEASDAASPKQRLKSVDFNAVDIGGERAVSFEVREDSEKEILLSPSFAKETTVFSNQKQPGGEKTDNAAEEGSSHHVPEEQAQASTFLSATKEEGKKPGEGNMEQPIPVIITPSHVKVDQGSRGETKEGGAEGKMKETQNGHDKAIADESDEDDSENDDDAGSSNVVTSGESMRKGTELGLLQVHGIVAKQRAHHIFAVSMVIILFFTYPSIVEWCANVLRCDTIDFSEMQPDGSMSSDVRSYFFYDRSKLCDSAQHTRFVVAGLVLGLAYGIGVPVVIVILYNRLRRPSSRGGIGFVAASRMFTFLIAGYRQPVWWWEALMLIRKLLLIYIVAFVRDSRLQTLLSFWVLAGHLGVHEWVRPYEYTTVDEMERYSLLVMCVTLNMSLLFDWVSLDNSDSGRQAAAYIIMIFILIINIALLIWMLQIIVVEGTTKVRKLIRDNRQTIEEKLPSCLARQLMKLEYPSHQVVQLTEEGGEGMLFDGGLAGEEAEGVTQMDLDSASDSDWSDVEFPEEESELSDAEEEEEEEFVLDGSGQLVQEAQQEREVEKGEEGIPPEDEEEGTGLQERRGQQLPPLVLHDASNGGALIGALPSSSPRGSVTASLFQDTFRSVGGQSRLGGVAGQLQSRAVIASLRQVINGLKEHSDDLTQKYTKSTQEVKHLLNVVEMHKKRLELAQEFAKRLEDQLEVQVEDLALVEHTLRDLETENTQLKRILHVEEERSKDIGTTVSPATAASKDLEKIRLERDIMARALAAQEMEDGKKASKMRSSGLHERIGNYKHTALAHRSVTTLELEKLAADSKKESSEREKLLKGEREAQTRKLNDALEKKLALRAAKSAQRGTVLSARRGDELLARIQESLSPALANTLGDTGTARSHRSLATVAAGAGGASILVVKRKHQKMGDATGPPSPGYWKQSAWKTVVTRVPFMGNRHRDSNTKTTPSPSSPGRGRKGKVEL